MKTVAIVNPTTGYRRARRVWPRLLASLGEPGAKVATCWTEWPGHAETLAAQARKGGLTGWWRWAVTAPCWKW